MGELMDEAERTIRRLRADARERQEDAEAVVAELAMASRTLRDAILDHARAGNSFRVELASTTLSGTVVHVGADLIRLVATDGRAVDVALAAVSAVRVEPSSRAAAPVTIGHPQSVLARCRELVHVNAEVEIGRPGPWVIKGRVMAATASHLELADDTAGSWLVPIGAVCWVRQVGD